MQQQSAAEARRRASSRLIGAARSKERRLPGDYADPRPGEDEQGVCARFYPVMEALARRMAASSGGGVDDLLSDCHVGIVKAIRNFRPDRGFRFTTYATAVLIGKMQEGLRERDPVSWYRKALRDAARGGDDGGPGLERAARAVELAETVMSWHDIGVPLDFVQALGRCADDVAARIDVADLLLGLEGRDLALVQLRFFGDLPYDEIGGLYGLSKQRVQQIVARGLERLRARAEARGAAVREVD